MDEIKVITDRVTVMRDGTYVGTLVTEECTKEDIVSVRPAPISPENPRISPLRSSKLTSCTILPAFAEHRPAGRQSVWREPAEGRYCEVADAQQRHPDF